MISHLLIEILFGTITALLIRMLEYSKTSISVFPPSGPDMNFIHVQSSGITLRAEVTDIER